MAAEAKPARKDPIALLSLGQRLKALKREVRERQSLAPGARLYNLVFDPTTEVFDDTYEPLKSLQRKVQYLVGKIREQIKGANGDEYGPLICYEFPYKKGSRVRLVKGCLSVLSAADATPSHVLTARTVLRALEKVDPTLRLINRCIDQAMNPFATPEQNRKASYSIQKLITGYKPLELWRPMSPVPLMVPVPKANSIHPFWKIQSIVHGSLVRGEETTWGNIESIARSEGFRSELCEVLDQSFVWLCDPLVRTGNGRLLVPWKADYEGGAGDILCTLTGKTPGLCLGGVSGGRSTDLLSAFFPDIVDVAPFYFEGGNLLEAVDREGRIVMLSGANNLTYSLINGPDSFTSLAFPIAQGMYSMTPQEATRAKVLLKRMRATRVYSQFSVHNSHLLAKAYVIGTKIIAERMEKTLQKKVIFLGTPFEKPVEYHLDLFLLPAPRGVVFIQDHRESIAVLQKILREEQLTPSEKARILLYLKNAEIEHREKNEQLTSIRQTLTSNGFIVVGFPGSFKASLEKLDVNFLNAIVGENENGVYCLSNGSSHPVDRFLRKAAALHWQKNGIARVYYTGRREKGPISLRGQLEFSAARKGLDKGGGIHCRAQVIRSNLISGTLMSVFHQLQKVDISKLSFRKTKPAGESTWRLFRKIERLLPDMWESDISGEESSDGADEDEYDAVRSGSASAAASAAASSAKISDVGVGKYEEKGE